MVKVVAIAPDGIAAQLGVLPGDQIVEVDDRPARDFLDVAIAEGRSRTSLTLEKPGGEHWKLDIEKDENEPFGFELEHPEPKRCGNDCIFCFVHQMPKGLRRSLYVKDEDYRFSYLYGAYVTLSNLDENDLERIVAQQLSPLYVSVHALDETVREQLLGRRTEPIYPLLQRLVDAGIEIHSQIVVCPGFNDGPVLKDTVERLRQLYPGIRSLALVPVGLTRHRDRLPKVHAVNKEKAGNILKRLERWQKESLDSFGSRFVFAADEFYLKADWPFPNFSDYEELPQLENGVGMTALFRFEAAEALQEAEELNCPVAFTVVTGMSFHDELQRFLNGLARRTGCLYRLHAIPSRLFGDSVTVAGLVCGEDIVAELRDKNPGSVLLVPDVMMRGGDQRFLDDLTPHEVGERLGCRVMVVPSGPLGLLEAVEGLAVDCFRGDMEERDES